MRLLITGVPGTGKTKVGNYLASRHAFEHFDFERRSVSLRFLGEGKTSLLRETATLKDRDVVVSWGFVPDAQLPYVLAMRDLGFEWFWFDGDRVAARREFIARGTVPVQALDVQMAAIDKHIDLPSLRPRQLNTFDGNGAFRPLADIAKEILRRDSV